MSADRTSWPVMPPLCKQRAPRVSGQVAVSLAFMLVTLYTVPESPGGGPIPSQPLADCPSIEVKPGPGWSVAQVLESGGFTMFQAFAPATPAIEADVSVGEDIDLAQFLNLFGIDEAGRLLFTSYEQPLSWDDFVRAVQQSVYQGDAGRLAVYQRGVAGGPSVEFLDQLLDLLLSAAPGAIAGAIAAKLVHPKQLINEVKHARRLQIAEKLRKRNFTGERLLGVLRRYPEWDPKQLERQFEFTELEAVRVLVNAGYQPREDGFWRRSDTPDGEHRRQALDQLEQRMWDEFGP